MIERFKKLAFNTIRKKMIVFSLLITMVSIITSFYTIYNSGHVISNFDSMFASNVHLGALSSSISDIDKELLNYLITENSDSLDLYMTNSEDLRNDAYSLIGLSFDANRLMLSNVGNMIVDYLEQADAAITAKRGRNIYACNIRYNSAKEISNQLDYYIKQLNFKQFEDTTQKYRLMSGKIVTLQMINFLIIILNLLFTVFVIFWFTEKMAIPIVNLAKYAEQISHGNFDVEDVKTRSEDEFKVLADTFNSMKGNIKIYIDELKFQAEMETRLMDEKVQNLKMKSLLKSAEIQALQSQINPHFLFNTLNAGVQLAMMERADRTGELLEKMSILFRYNLRRIGNPVTLREEISNLYTYVYILEIRFGDMIRFEFELEGVDSSVGFENALFRGDSDSNFDSNDIYDMYMPPMIIQPLIENACIHGVGDMDKGGIIRFSVQHEGDFVRIVISDNGSGMDEETVERILRLDDSEIGQETRSKTGHTTGIGFHNVHRRLNVFYEREDLISIKSRPGEGTSITLMLPLVKGVQEDDQNSDR